MLQLSHDQQLLDKISLQYLMNRPQIRKQQGNRIIETNKQNILSTYCNLKYECTSHRRWMDSRIRTHGEKIIEMALRGVWEKGDFSPQSSFEFVERKDNSKDYYCFFKCDRLCVAVGNIVLFLLTFLPNSLSFPVGKCFLCSG